MIVVFTDKIDRCNIHNYGWMHSSDSMEGNWGKFQHFSQCTLDLLSALKNDMIWLTEQISYKINIFTLCHIAHV